MKLDARILVVEDDPSQRELLVGFLRDLGARVEEAGDGRVALEIVRRESVDVVVTDLRIPELDGHALLKAIREINPEISTVVVTAYGTVEGAVACLKDGAFHYLLVAGRLTVGWAMRADGRPHEGRMNGEERGAWR